MRKKELVNFHTKGKFFEDAARNRWENKSPGKDANTATERAFLSQITDLLALKKDLNYKILLKEQEISQANFVINCMKEKNQHLRMVISQKEDIIVRIISDSQKTERVLIRSKTVPKTRISKEAWI
ncbi:unnamed protein product [Blepharisma stoltei]|uniref:Uncharacterized protein n=1 Tax=Blepharisma stoltei TaxID=1481888 RepID=A0AAU9IWJ7_9CILI|nr:unnamed protein product [Blepharisma stoltei]